jgi:hypothetical protein
MYGTGHTQQAPVVSQTSAPPVNWGLGLHRVKTNKARVTALCSTETPQTAANISASQEEFPRKPQHILYLRFLGTKIHLIA